MNSASVHQVLNRLYILHHRSLAAYLEYAAPWAKNGEVRSLEVLHGVSADHRSLAARLATLIIDLDGGVNHGAFPLSYTGLHDLGFSFLLTQLIQEQRRMVRAIE